MIVRHSLLYKMKTSFCEIIRIWWGSQTSHPNRKKGSFVRKTRAKSSK